MSMNLISRTCVDTEYSSQKMVLKNIFVFNSYSHFVFFVFFGKCTTMCCCSECYRSVWAVWARKLAENGQGEAVSHAEQPKDPVLPKLPATGILLGPSKSGKTAALLPKPTLLTPHSYSFRMFHILFPLSHSLGKYTKNVDFFSLPSQLPRPRGQAGRCSVR